MKNARNPLFSNRSAQKRKPNGPQPTRPTQSAPPPSTNRPVQPAPQPTRQPIQQSTRAKPPPPSTILVQSAVQQLQIAGTIPLTEASLFREDRHIWLPHSWLIQCCWQTLADAGAAQEAIAVANLAATRQPLAPMQALYRLSKDAPVGTHLHATVQGELERVKTALFNTVQGAERTQEVERLLFAAACAAHLYDDSLAFACLERLDQFAGAWNHVLVRTELRTVLAETVARIGLHPLTSVLISGAIRRFDDAGTHFLQQVIDIATELSADRAGTKSARLILRCTEAFLHSTLTNLNIRRIAASVFAKSGRVENLLEQLTTITNIQEARRASGLDFRKDAELLVRQVKRPNANSDVDFLIYTLQEAIDVLPIERISQEQRAALVTQLAGLGVRSDGWTAAGTASKLLKLGAVKEAVEVIKQIRPNDPTRSEGIISLVDGLLGIGETKRAGQQAKIGLEWAKSLPERTPERALTWGIAETYIDHNQPQVALALIKDGPKQLGFFQELRQLFSNKEMFGDEELRNYRIRFQALLQQKATLAVNNELSTLRRQMQQAPRLLDGEALVAFYMEGMLQPLLRAGRIEEAWQLLPDLMNALTTIRGARHATRVNEVAKLLVAQIVPELYPQERHLSHPITEQAQLDHTFMLFAQFSMNLWQRNAEQGIWQTAYGIEGSLPLILLLEGPQALLLLARIAVEQGEQWCAQLLKPIPSPKDSHSTYRVPSQEDLQTAQ